VWTEDDFGGDFLDIICGDPSPLVGRVGNKEADMIAAADVKWRAPADSAMAPVRSRHARRSRRETQPVLIPLETIDNDHVGTRAV